ncbi:PhzF family phenazine biosynthesis protein [Parvularcula sp. ZS-1/3]|uniref:PhzF family phenazine biosynthesis protein n=1 Tax=Parvularcula mediterranea TaxID=2732508 RepID=A0A7Y3RNF8_9PROT|nr:PhzF family phenazine biosynthesis protein [Parvularcula mediterranea]NNU17311.1 PhzF family phenazine biosynthesis protein [Parvularcula mediterranea]
MRTHDFVVVDAFTEKAFGGNPAAVMILDDFYPDDLLLKIAQEHNLSETAFLVKKGEAHYDLRWFTPGGEVPLCGHATMASGYALFTEHGLEADEVRFETLSGTLKVSREKGRYALDLPANMPTPVEHPPSLVDALGVDVEAVLEGQFWLVVLPTEDEVRMVRPNMAAIEALPVPELGITAPGRDVDFVSRLFAPKLGIPEDPFTGSLHAMLVPYWSERLGKTSFKAHQASSRGGDADCELSSGRVVLRGNAATTMRGQLFF